MFHIWRTASSRSLDWCAARRRRLRAAGASGAGRRAGRLLRAARPSGRACDILHHSMLALEPSMALASFSLSLLMQVHEAAAMAESGGDAGDQRDAARAGDLCRRVSIPRHPPRCRVNQTNRSQGPPRAAATPCRSPSTIHERLRAPHTCPPRQLGAARSCTLL